ncbi:uncharacterized protein PV09_04440 [Verruconis gallopava]|uniref:Response regulatory domain-containing protein n=1 Tax=Verruconis gallopava TaxID=253628 RepID=A0A0D1YVH6_9PEZI|nr:uncharacterized protein PV09_04440 [Verruconis gallopava]KIW04707.1 hypothetical protein PV09_04440 [Verruconis gallopava]
MFKSRLRSKNLFRRSNSSTQFNDNAHVHAEDKLDQPSSPRSRPVAGTITVSSSPTVVRKPKQSRSFSSLRDTRKKSATADAVSGDVPPTLDVDPKTPLTDAGNIENQNEHTEKEGGESLKSAEGTLLDSSIISLPGAGPAPEVVVEEATPGIPPPANPIDVHVTENTPVTPRRGGQTTAEELLAAEALRKQSLVSRADVDIIKALLHDEQLDAATLHRKPPSLQRGFTTASETTALNASMLSRKVWVKRPHAAATIVLIKEDDLVDEAKEAILQKYRNQLSRHFDAPDITIRILTRGEPGERILNPDEPLCRTLDSYYPGGQSVDEALIIDVPQRRTPRPSPRVHSHHSHNRSHDSFQFYDEGERSARPHESATDYFPPMPPVNLGQPSPLLTNTSHDSHSHDSRKSHAAHERAISVLNTGQVPPLPSPGAVGRRAHMAKQHSRPAHPRQHTSSPTTLSSSVASRGPRPHLDSTASTEKHPQLSASTATLPTPPAPEPKTNAAAAAAPLSGNAPPTPRVSSPRPGGRPSRKTRQKQKDEGPTALSLPPGILDTSVPPINVLIVEDNMINMRLLEQFVRRLGVRWQTAVNGREAVTKWRQGGFHLVLMDIQLPIMSGLEATKEIRRLERVNNIGVFSSASSSAPELDEECDPLDASGRKKEVRQEDRLFEDGYSRLFKSPVIIVALTASNLQSDRHEALAAGCNDFLTKPVNFVWFERKVKEWGCMQALIDFDGWRKWKDFAEANGLKDPSKPAGAPIKRKALKPESTAVSKASDAKSLDGKGQEKVVGSDRANTSPSEQKDFASTNPSAEGTKGENVAKENSTDTMLHTSNTSG